MRPTTAGSLLGGRVSHVQPASGFRSGIEPVLLAAAVDARAGDRVLEAGTGAGAALLCLAARVPGVEGIGVEADPDMAALARLNARANGARLTILAEDIAGVSVAPVRHALANPPYHLGGTPSPHPARERAKRAGADTMAVWVRAMSHVLTPRGTLTLIVPAALIGATLAAMADAGCGSPRLFPLWPRAGKPAGLMLIRAIRGGRSPLVLLPGLVLHGAAGFTDEAHAVLRYGEALRLT